MLPTRSSRTARRRSGREEGRCVVILERTDICKKERKRRYEERKERKERKEEKERKGKKRRKGKKQSTRRKNKRRSMVQIFRHTAREEIPLYIALPH
jgi:hypothetical protein